MNIKSLIIFVAVEIVVMVLTFTHCHNAHRHRHCLEPEEFPDMDRADYNNITALQFRSLLFGPVDREPVQNSNIVRHQFYVTPEEGTSTSGSMFITEVCRSNFVFNTDNTRKPETLLEHRCYTETANVHGHFYLCNPMMMYVSVLRRGACVHGIWTYQRAWEPLSVACIAINPPSPIERINTGPFSPK